MGESRRLMTAEESEKVPGQRRRSRDEKAAKQSREDSAGSQTRRGGRGTVSLDMSNAATAAHFQQHLGRKPDEAGRTRHGQFGHEQRCHCCPLSTTPQEEARRGGADAARSVWT